MGFWSRAFGREKKGAESFLDLMRDFGMPTHNIASLPITPSQALDVATVLCAVRVLAEGVAQVPWKLFRETAEGRQAATDHPLYDLLSWRPNELQSSFEFRETMMFHTVLTGNGFAFLDRVGNDRSIRSITPIPPGDVTVKNKSGVPQYFVRTDDRQQVEVPRDLIWHWRGPSWQPWLGLNATTMARRSIGLAAAIEDGQTSFYKNGAQVSGVLSVEGSLTAEKHERFLSMIRDRFTKLQAGSPMLVDQGGKWQQLQMSGVDSQLVETRKHQIEEIGRAFRVLPIMLMHAEKTATYASAEQMFIAHVVHTLSPWYERIEQSADINLLSEQDRSDGTFSKFMAGGLMRGAAKDRAEFYARALGSGGSAPWMVVNEVRAFEDLPPIEGGDQLIAGTQGDANAT